MAMPKDDSKRTLEVLDYLMKDSAPTRKKKRKAQDVAVPDAAPSLDMPEEDEPAIPPAMIGAGF